MLRNDSKVVESTGSEEVLVDGAIVEEGAAGGEEDGREPSVDDAVVDEEAPESSVAAGAVDLDEDVPVESGELVTPVLHADTATSDASKV